MDRKDLPSSSDESDEDFVLKEDYKSDSDSEESDFETSKDEDDENNSKGRKRKKGSKKKGKKFKIGEKEEEDEEEEKKEKETNEENKQIDINALWEDFKKDVNNPVAKKTNEVPESNLKETEEVKKTNSSENCNVKSSAEDKQPRSSVNFPSRGRGRGRGVVRGGLSSVLNKIGKKDKMSTLQKSQLDWNNFKKSEGIEEEIKLHNRGKDGYLDKQDFLQRTDLRQFEIEKDLRSTRRKF